MPSASNNDTIPYPIMPEEVEKNSSGAKHIRYLNILSKLAADIPNPAKRNSRVAACIVYKNDVVSLGVSERKSHPFQAKYGKNEEAIYLHAETSAIRNALKYISMNELEKSTLYVCRIKYEDTFKRKLVFGLSKPCTGCARCISTFGIRNVVYSIDGNGYVLLNGSKSDSTLS